MKGLAEHWLKWAVVALSTAVCAALWFAVTAWAEDKAEEKAKAHVDAHVTVMRHIDDRDLRTAVEVGKVDRKRLEDKIEAQDAKLDAILEAIRQR